MSCLLNEIRRSIALRKEAIFFCSIEDGKRLGMEKKSSSFILTHVMPCATVAESYKYSDAMQIERKYHSK